MRDIKKKFNQFGLLAAALGFFFGHTASDFFNSIVTDAIMPGFNLMLDVEDWQQSKINIGTYSMIWGNIVKNGIRFVIVAVSIIYILRWLEMEEK
ncbi:MAG: hypothetical protein CL573_05300 [Alphaproteobacteria bacterium]|nr:hypothetical protein [Alphaproteobacteria bacterium]|tara:strand:- start:197 stop:481 length:285 start_codon:yes stop_codon:yes gene_type:complete